MEGIDLICACALRTQPKDAHSTADGLMLGRVGEGDQILYLGRE